MAVGVFSRAWVRLAEGARPRAERTESGVMTEERGNTDKISDSRTERSSGEAGG